MSLLAAPGVGPAVYPPRNILASGPSTVAQQFERRLVMRCQYLLGSICRGCYRGHMTTFRYDYDSLAGMPAASTVALSCADTMSAKLPAGPRRRIATSGSPCACGYSAILPPQQWARAPAGSKGLKKNLINISASLLSLPGTSSDIPVVRCIQFCCSAIDFTQIIHSTFPVLGSTMLTATHPASPCAPRRHRRTVLSRRTFENYTVVASALVAEIR